MQREQLREILRRARETKEMIDGLSAAEVELQPQTARRANAESIWRKGESDATA